MCYQYFNTVATYIFKFYVRVTEFIIEITSGDTIMIASLTNKYIL